MRRLACELLLEPKELKDDTEDVRREDDADFLAAMLPMPPMPMAMWPAVGDVSPLIVPAHAAQHGE